PAAGNWRRPAVGEGGHPGAGGRGRCAQVGLARRRADGRPGAGDAGTVAESIGSGAARQYEEERGTRGAVGCRTVAALASTAGSGDTVTAGPARRYSLPRGLAKS